MSYRDVCNRKAYERGLEGYSDLFLPTTDEEDSARERGKEDRARMDEQDRRETAREDAREEARQQERDDAESRSSDSDYSDSEWTWNGVSDDGPSGTPAEAVSPVVPTPRSSSISSTLVWLAVGVAVTLVMLSACASVLWTLATTQNQNSTTISNTAQSYVPVVPVITARSHKHPEVWVNRTGYDLYVMDIGDSGWYFTQNNTTARIDDGTTALYRTRCPSGSVKFTPHLWQKDLTCR